MWYAGNDQSRYQIGYATSSDGVAWTKSGSNPVIAYGRTGTPGNWDYNQVMHPEVIKNGSTYQMWYVGHYSSYQIGYATSSDGITWTRLTDPILTPPAWASGNLISPAVAYDGSTYHLWFATGGLNARDIGYAYNEDDPADPADWTILPNTATNPWSDLGFAGDAEDRVALRWRVDLAKDVYGNTITYTYTEETETVAGKAVTYDRASYLDKIRYTGTGGEACDPTTEACYEVRFVTETRAEGYDVPDEEDREDWDTWDEKLLDKVEVYAMDSSGDELLRTYDLTFSEVERQDSDGDTETWDSLILDDIVVTAGSLDAPKISFDYTMFDNRAQVLGEPEWAYPRLTAIHNGTGGAVTFTYGEDGRPADQYYAWRVLWREVDDGVSGALNTMRTTYTYGPACYQDHAHGWCNDDDEGALVGHDWTVETVKGFGVVRLTLGSTKTYFLTDEDHVGRTYQSDTRDENGVVYFQSETDYTTIDWSTNPDYPEGVRFIYADETRQYERQGQTIELVTRTAYTYDDDWGDLLTQHLYDGDGNLLTRTVYTYLANVALPGTFLHSFARSAITYDSQDTVLAASYYAYDDTAAGLGTVGELTLQQTRTLTDSSQTTDLTYTYDAYGNLTETRAHGSYGTLGTLPTGNATLDRVGTVSYDSTYHAYPVTTTNPLGHQTTVTYDFQLTPAEPPLGLIRQTTDPNGATATTVYDDLGRIVETWQPGAAQANVKITFPALNQDGEIDAPYTIQLENWDDGGPGADQYREAWTFYDGLGRALRIVGPAETSGDYIQSDVRFNAMGLADRASRPYEVTLATPPGTYSAPNWASLHYSQADYDAFGRPVLLTAADNTTVQTLYDGRTTAVIDPNGHQSASLVDDFGRLIEVREYTGEADPYTLYATTTYAYDARSLLTSVTDDQDNVTTITYDALGRKIDMDDPDMGEWEYDYDLWNQLIQQTDARGAQIRYEYDKLGRPTLRQSRMTELESWVTVASFGYDDTTGGNYGIGRPTSTDSVYVGGSPTVSDAIVYDLLGRPTDVTRTIDGTDYPTQYSYDSLGRLMSMTYPDPDGAGPLTAETVNYTYNARGLFESLIGTDTYVSSTDYTAFGAVDHQTLGNGVITDYTYEEDSQRLERILTGKPAYLPLVDLSYTYDDTGNVTQVDDDVHEELRSYVYDDLDRLVFADVYSGTQMIEERYYTYDTIGNLLSFRHRYPASGWGTGSVAAGGEQMSGGSYDSNGSFNSMSGQNLSSENYQSAGILPFIAGLRYSTAGPNNTRGAVGSAGQSISTNYVNYGAFNSATGSGSATSYDGRGINPYVYGEGGGYGDSGGGYSGPTGETIVNYTYGENDAGPHAVTSRSNGDSFAYDDNGNMTSRAMDGVTWTHIFDAENRLVEVDDGTTETTYVYDASGNRVKRIVDDGIVVTTTIYAAGMEIELEGSTETQRTIYYSAGGTFRIIGGSDAGLYFKHGDHLGSISVLSDSTGAKVADSDVLYAPFGEVRTGEQTDLTDFGFTGQRNDSSTGGLMYYGARYYLPELRRFISADTIVPGAANPQAFNRYSYVLNSPVNFTDPTGHAIAKDAEGEDIIRVPLQHSNQRHYSRFIPNNPTSSSDNSIPHTGSGSSGNVAGSGDSGGGDINQRQYQIIPITTDLLERAAIYNARGMYEAEVMAMNDWWDQVVMESMERPLLPTWDLEGVRLDITIKGGDLNIDIVYINQSNTLSVFATPGYEADPTANEFTFGPLRGEGFSKPSDYAGILTGDGLNGGGGAGPNLELEVSKSPAGLGPEHDQTVIYFGVGGGSDLSPVDYSVSWVTINVYTFDFSSGEEIWFGGIFE